MDLSNPASAVVPSLDAAVLRVLAGTSRPLTGREVQRLCERSQRGVQNILDRMADHGLVDVTDAGRARLYTLNRDHVAADAVLVLSDLRGRLFQRIRERLRGWEPGPVAAAVFGSAARGDGDPGSDIDLFIVRSDDVDESNPTWASLVDDLARCVLRWSGNHASVIQANQAQVTSMVRRGEPVVDELRADAVPLTETTVLPAQRTRR